MAKVFWSPGVLAQIENLERIVSQKRWRWGLEVTQKGIQIIGFILAFRVKAVRTMLGDGGFKIHFQI